MMFDGIRPVMTIGHSTLSIDDFVGRARHDGIREIIDVRSHPTSRHPQFRQEAMQEWLPKWGLKYEWEPNLGGWDVRHAHLAPVLAPYGVNLTAYLRGHFPKQRIAAERVGDDGGPEWTNVGLYDYSWYTVLPEFVEAAKRLVERTREVDLVRPAIMCCEFLWWKCHRSMVADYLVHVHEQPVFHIQPKLTSHQSALGNRIERYPAPVRELWKKHAPVKESK